MAVLYDSTQLEGTYILPLPLAIAVKLNALLLFKVHIPLKPNVILTRFVQLINALPEILLQTGNTTLLKLVQPQKPFCIFEQEGRYISVKPLQSSNVYEPKLVNIGKLTILNLVQLLNACLPVDRHTGKLILTKLLQLINALSYILVQLESDTVCNVILF